MNYDRSAKEKPLVWRYKPAGLSVRESNLWEYAASADWKEDFWSIHYWKPWLVRMYLLQYKHNEDRYSLFFWFVANGLRPEQAHFTIMAADAYVAKDKHWRLVKGNYDAKAHLQLQVQFPRELIENRFFKGHKDYYDLNTGTIKRA